MDPLKISAWACIAVAVAGLLVGCATSPIPIGLPCNVGPVLLDTGASKRLTRDEQVQLAVINETGERLCKWKAP
jgi:hypothetical protein